MRAAPRDGKEELNAEMSQPAAQVDDLGISRTDEAQEWLSSSRWRGMIFKASCVPAIKYNSRPRRPRREPVGADREACDRADLV